MNAFIYALNDSDERVRAKAADEIGDQVSRKRCICGPPVIRALRAVLADCDRNVRREAKSALKLCGFKVVDCKSSDGCGGGYCPAQYTANSGVALWTNQLKMVPQQVVEDATPPPASNSKVDSAPVDSDAPPVVPVPTEISEADRNANSKPMTEQYNADPKPAAPVSMKPAPLPPKSGGKLQSFFRSRLPGIMKSSARSELSQNAN